MEKIYFKQNLKKLMKQNNLTQDRVSEVASVARQTVSLWLKGSTEPSLTAILRLSSYFDLSVEELVYKKENKRKEPLMRYVPMVSDIEGNDVVLSYTWIDCYDLAAKVSIDADFAFIMDDNSMIEHRIKKGDIVMVKETKKIKKNSLVYAIIDDKQYLRRYEKIKNDVLLLTDNSKFHSLCLNEKEVHILGVATAFRSDI